MPHASSSAVAIAPARDTAMSAAASAFGMSLMYGTVHRRHSDRVSVCVSRDFTDVEVVRAGRPQDLQPSGCARLRPCEGAEQRFVDRARALAAAHDQHAPSHSRRKPKRCAARRAVER